MKYLYTSGKEVETRDAYDETRISHVDALKVGSYDSARYGKFEITPDDLLAYQGEFRASNAGGRRQIDFDHKGSQGETRAAGWIKDLHIVGDKLKAEVEWTQAGVDAIKRKEYKFTSAEYTDKVRNKTTGETVSKRMLKAVTLTNRPFIESMDPVSLSDDPEHQVVILEDDKPSELDWSFLAELLCIDEEDLVVLAQGNIGGTSIRKLPNSSYAWVDSSGKGHLPYKDSSGKIDAAHTRNALARLNQVHGMSPAQRASAKKKLQAALKSVGGNPSGDTDDNGGKKNMSDLHTVLSLDDDADDATVLSAVKALVDKSTKAAEGTVTLSEFNEVKKQAEDATIALHTMHRDTYLSEQVRERRITPAELEGFQKLYDIDPATVRGVIEARKPMTLAAVGKDAEPSSDEIKVLANDGRDALDRRAKELMSENPRLSYGEAMIRAGEGATE